MTTKLYKPSAAPVLFTAAEARRIDIERGGEGRVQSPTWAKAASPYWLRFDEATLQWITIDKDVYGGRDCGGKHWLPLAPEPEAEKEENMVELWQQLDKLKQAEIKIEQLEKELEATLEKSLKHKRDAESCKQELAELKEKAKWKRCLEETPANQSDVFYQDEREEVIGHGHFRDGKWWLAIGDSKYLCLSKEQVLPLKWKYEADL